jgi:hypothetical protein
MGTDRDGESGGEAVFRRATASRDQPAWWPRGRLGLPWANAFSLLNDKCVSPLNSQEQLRLAVQHRPQMGRVESHWLHQPQEETTALFAAYPHASPLACETAKAWENHNSFLRVSGLTGLRAKRVFVLESHVWFPVLTLPFFRSSGDHVTSLKLSSFTLNLPNPPFVSIIRSDHNVNRATNEEVVVDLSVIATKCSRPFCNRWLTQARRLGTRWTCPFCFSDASPLELESPA